MSTSPSPTPSEPKALPRVNPPQITEIACPEEEAAQRPPTNESGEEVAPATGIQPATARYFLMSNISVIVKGNNMIKPARKDIFKMAMEPFPDIVNPTLTFGDRISYIPVEIHALQDYSLWTVEELNLFLFDGTSPKPHGSKRWEELLGTYRFPKEKIRLKTKETITVRRSAARFFVNNALLCYTPESQYSKDTTSQAQASELAVLSLSVSTGPQAMLDLTKSTSAHASSGTYIHQNQPGGTDRNALYRTGVNALVGGVVSGLFSL